MASTPIRTAFITGASSGIGSALAKRLASEGVTVALAARREQALRDLADEIEAAGGRATIHPVDVSDPHATISTITAADDEHDGLDVVIANAGVGKGQWSGKLTWEDCANVLAVNVAGATATLVAAIPRMVERKRGHLVGISSIASYRGLPKFAVYSGSKAYLSTFLEGLRVDLRSTGVAVTDIRPGFVETPMTEDNGKMPFVVTAEDAAGRIYRAIRARKDVLTFPLPMAGAAKTMAALPNAIYDRMMKLG